MARIEALPVEAMTDLWDDRGVPAHARPAAEDAGLAVWCAEMPGNFWTIQLPEAMGSMERPAASFRPVVRQAWEPGASGDWGYSRARWQPGSGQEEAARFPGEISCRTRTGGHSLNAELTLHNSSQKDWPSPYLWICLVHRYALQFEPRTWVRADGRFLPFEATCPEDCGPAGMRMLTNRGRDEMDRLGKLGLDDGGFCEYCSPVGLRAATGKIEGRCCVAGLASPNAAILGGCDDNPCTDLGVSFGPVPQGESRSVRLAAYFLFGTLDDFAGIVAGTPWDRLME